MTEHRNRLTSSRDYYPTISELLAAAPNELSIFTSKAKKSTLECLLRGTLSQLNDCKKKSETSSGIISETAQAVKSIERKLVNVKPGANHQGMSSSQHTNYADAVKRTLDKRDYDIKAEETIVLFNIAEAMSSQDDSNVQTLCDRLKIVPEKIKNIVRLGKRKPEASARLRPVEIQLASS